MSDEQVFNFILRLHRWADAECVRQELDSNRDNRRKVLGDAIALIRFPLMTVEEFALGPAQSGTLTERETVDLFLYFTLNPKPRVSELQLMRSIYCWQKTHDSHFRQLDIDIFI